LRNFKFFSASGSEVLVRGGSEVAVSMGSEVLVRGRVLREERREKNGKLYSKSGHAEE
jgi:hypothetical protein